MIQLRPYQHEAIDAVEKALDKGVQKPLVVLPTGTGKTVVFSRAIEKRGGTALVLAHRDELIQQAAEKLAAVAPELADSIGTVKAEKNDVDAKIIVGSVQTLSRDKRLAQLPTKFDTVVIDEAHHAAADSYLKIIEHLDDSPLILGVTATPERADSKDLAEVWETTVYARSILEMIEGGYLASLKGYQVQIDGLDLRTVKVSGGDYQAGDLGRLMEETFADRQVARAYRDMASDRKGIVFTPTVDVAHATAKELNKLNIPAGAVDATTPQDERRQLLGDLKSGKLQVICNCGVLTEGFDEPSVSAIVVARPTRSRGLYVQMVGRGTRIHPGKEDCMILDFSGAEVDLKAMNLPGIFDIDATEYEEGKAIEEAVAEYEAKQTKIGKRKVTEKNLFARSEVRWIKVEPEGDTRWVLSLGGDDLVVLDPHDGGFRVLQMGESKAKVIASGMDLGYAQGIGEEMIRRSKAGGLNKKRAAWHEHDATAGQASFLWALGKRKQSKQAKAGEMTKGEAAQAITEAQAEDRLNRFDVALAARAAAEDKEPVPA
jgi:superfamily II DNA or RNA helicase